MNVCSVSKSKLYVGCRKCCELFSLYMKCRKLMKHVYNITLFVHALLFLHNKTILKISATSAKKRRCEPMKIEMMLRATATHLQNSKKKMK